MQKEKYMICCKIIADYNNAQGSFSKLCELLGKKGDWKWAYNAMYFADTEGATTEKQVIQCVKKAGYSKYYIDVYDSKHEPRNEEDSVYGWIAGNVAKITYKKFATENEKVLLQTKEGLDALEKEVDNLINEAIKNLEESKKSDTTEDKS